MNSNVSIGLPAPDFTLTDLEGVPHALKDYLGRIIILDFWSCECPWSERTDMELLRLYSSWGDQVRLLFIASNANETGEQIRQTAQARRLPLVLLDPCQQVADLYGAQITPQLFVVDSLGILRYRGAFDDVTFRKRTPAQAYLKQAITALLAASPPNPVETPPYGCSIVRFAL
ncbi:MAG: redoxin domain-containing protein [Omnitrophica WOR_2 bacterium]